MSWELSLTEAQALERYRQSGDFDFDFMYKNDVVSHVYVNLKTHIVTCKHSKKYCSLYRPFSYIDNPTWKDFDTFLKFRTFPPGRGNEAEVLKSLGLSVYNRLDIVRVTHGTMVDDYQWMRFPEEKDKIRFEDVKVRD